MELFVQFGYIGLFVSSFLAATLLPVSSEIVFVSLVLAKFDAALCLIVATIGNWLGGMTNYYLGRMGKKEWIEKYLKVSSKDILRMQKKLHNKGAYIAFFSFLPIVGDLIALTLGFMHANVYIVNLSLFFGKLTRYLILFYGIQQGIKWLYS